MFKPTKPSSPPQTLQQQTAFTNLKTYNFPLHTVEILFAQAKGIGDEFQAWKRHVDDLQSGKVIKHMGQTVPMPQDLDIKMREWIKAVVWGVEQTFVFPVGLGLPFRRSWWLAEPLEQAYTSGNVPRVEVYIPDSDMVSNNFIATGFPMLQRRIEQVFVALNDAMPQPLVFKFVVAVGPTVKKLLPDGEHWTSSNRFIRAENSVFEGGEKKKEEEKKGGGGGKSTLLGYMGKN